MRLFPLLLAVPIAAFAQLPAFAPDAATPSPEEIKAHVTDKVFIGKRASDGFQGQFEYRSDGKFFVNYGSFNESGTWTAENGKICVQDPRNGPACNEVRMKDGVIFYRRNRNGEVFPLHPK